jgi:5-methyltetrahydropteroyltriglutamate--homocysteine methyltransferase
VADLDGLRVDQVGSLLRPAHLREMFERHGRGEASDDDVRRAQDDAIRQVVRQEESHHLPVVTDGEYRRLGFQDNIANSLTGFAATTNTAQFMEHHAEGGQAGQRWETRRHEVGPAIVQRRPAAERLRLVRNVALEEFQFVQALTERPAKITLIGPDRISQRFAWEDSTSIYPGGLDEFVQHVVEIERQIVGELVAAGCKYIQIDAPSYTAYVDQKLLDQMRSRGEDPERNLERSIAADNALIAGFPGVTFGIHLCRGNQRSMWHRDGAYDAIAEKLFSGLAHQRLLLEYDDERSGSFEPLRFVPPGKTAVLGLITTKTPRAETVDSLSARLEEAGRFLPLQQLALSPQCGFASDFQGNLITEDDQWRKIDVMVETAQRVWG